MISCLSWTTQAKLIRRVGGERAMPLSPGQRGGELLPAGSLARILGRTHLPACTWPRFVAIRREFVDLLTQKASERIEGRRNKSFVEQYKQYTVRFSLAHCQRCTNEMLMRQFLGGGGGRENFRRQKHAPILLMLSTLLKPIAHFEKHHH